MATKKKLTKAIQSLPSKTLTSKNAKSIKGGKHIGQPKYEDITVNCGTGMSKTTQ
jgi:hypothetical protein